MLQACHICKRISCRCSSGIGLPSVIGTYGIWVSNHRRPMLPQHFNDGGFYGPPVRPFDREARDREAWERVKRRKMDQIQQEEIRRLKVGPRVKVAPAPPPPPPPPQPPPDDLDPILLEYARTAKISCKGYENDRAWWRRRVIAEIKLRIRDIERREEE